MIFTDDDLIAGLPLTMSGPESFVSNVELLKQFDVASFLYGTSERDVIYADSHSILEVGYSEYALAYFGSGGSVKAGNGSDLILFANGDSDFNLAVDLDQDSKTTIFVDVSKYNSSHSTLEVSGEGLANLVLSGINGPVSSATIDQGQLMVAEEGTGIFIAKDTDVLIYDTSLNVVALDSGKDGITSSASSEDVDIDSESVIWSNDDIVIYELDEVPLPLAFDQSAVELSSNSFSSQITVFSDAETQDYNEVDFSNALDVEPASISTAFNLLTLESVYVPTDLDVSDLL